MVVELPDQTKRVRPEADRTDSENTWRRSEVDSTATEPLDLVTATPEVRFSFWDGYTAGYCAGHEAGRKFADDEIATLQREAARIVHRLAEIPERDREADRAAAARREARWSA